MELKKYFEKEKAELLKRKEDTLRELEMLNAAMNEIAFAQIEPEETVRLVRYVNGGQERDRNRLKIIEDRLHTISRLLELLA